MTDGILSFIFYSCADYSRLCRHSSPCLMALSGEMEMKYLGLFRFFKSFVFYALRNLSKEHQMYTIVMHFVKFIVSTQQCYEHDFQPLCFYVQAVEEWPFLYVICTISMQDRPSAALCLSC